MHFWVYELREDEKQSFERLSAEFGVTLSYENGALTMSSADQAAGCDGVTILGRSSLNAELLEKMAELGIRYVVTRTIGYNHIDLKRASELGITVCNANYAPNGVADYTVMLMLLSLRHYKQALWRQQVNDYSLFGLQGRELKDLTVGILGTGKIGLQTILNLRGFGCRILAYDIHKNSEAEKYAEYAGLEDIYRECDVISLHMPLTEDTYHVVNENTIAKMKHGVVIVNCARGELTDIKALIKGIEEEQIGALALDVIEKEEGIYHQDRRIDIIKNRDMAYLRQFPNVIMTQHMAFFTDAAVDSMVRCAVEGLTELNKNGTYGTELHVN